MFRYRQTYTTLAEPVLITVVLLSIVGLILVLFAGCSIKTEKVCPTLIPVPATMSIEIDGAKVDTDDNGEDFLSKYDAVRKCQSDK